MNSDKLRVWRRGEERAKALARLIEQDNRGWTSSVSPCHHYASLGVSPGTYEIRFWKKCELPFNTRGGLTGYARRQPIVSHDSVGMLFVWPGKKIRVASGSSKELYKIVHDLGLEKQ